MTFIFSFYLEKMRETETKPKQKLHLQKKVKKVKKGKVKKEKEREQEKTCLYRLNFGGPRECREGCEGTRPRAHSRTREKPRNPWRRSRRRRDRCRCRWIGRCSRRPLPCRPR